MFSMGLMSFMLVMEVIVIMSDSASSELENKFIILAIKKARQYCSNLLLESFFAAFP